MALVTRKATGKPSWPITLLAGMQSAGKSFTAAQASASPLVSRTLWVGFGESDPDYLAAIPGVDFEIVVHDGTIRSLLESLDEIAKLPVPDEGPILVVIDSGSRYWDVLSERAQYRANRRQKRDDATIGVDLWNEAKRDWQRVLNVLRKHKGPSIITARFEEVAIVVGGKPTGEKQWRIKAEKGAPYDVDAVIEMRSRGEYLLSKIRTTQFAFDEALEWPGFTMHDLWTRMGLTGPVADRNYTGAEVGEGEVDTAAPAGPGRDWATELAEADTPGRVAALGQAATAAKAPTSVLEAIRAKHGALLEATKKKGETHG